MQKFKETIRVPRPRADGSPGFREFKKGRTPESYDLTPEEMDKVKSQLVEFEGVTATFTLNKEELLALLTEEEKFFHIFAAMLLADPEKKDEELWTAKGVPRMEIIEDVLGDKTINTDQRDEAWANFQEEV